MGGHYLILKQGCMTKSKNLNGRTCILVPDLMPMKLAGYGYALEKYILINGYIYRLLKCAMVMLSEEGDAAVSYESYERYRKDWETRTETLTRMEVADIGARKEAALMHGDVEAAQNYRL